MLYNFGVLCSDSSILMFYPEKIDPKVESKWSRQGLKMGHRPKLGSYGKIGFLDQKPRFWAQKKDSLLDSHHVLATTGKSCSKKKSAFAQIIKVGNIILGDFLG